MDPRGYRREGGVRRVGCQAVLAALEGLRASPSSLGPSASTGSSALRLAAHPEARADAPVPFIFKRFHSTSPVHDVRKEGVWNKVDADRFALERAGLHRMGAGADVPLVIS